VNNEKGYKPLVPDILVHERAFQSYQAECSYTFYLLNQENESVEGLFTFFVVNNVATTAVKAPFGFVEMLFFDKWSFAYIVTKVELFFKELGIKTLSIRSLPDFYQSAKISIAKECLLLANFYCLENLCNYYIPVDGNDFESKIAPSQLGRMNRSLNAGFHTKCLGHEQLEAVYRFILECRAERNYGGLVSLMDLQRITAMFPDRYFLFVVLDKDESIAAANISVKMSDDILYTWYSHHLFCFNSFSPVILLHKYIYDFCMGRNIKFIDLSVAKEGDGNEKISLQKFKKRIGGIESIRTEFRKEI
jgi:hypothetical protein